MSLRSRFVPALVAIFAFAGATTQITSCALESYGTQPPEQGSACASDANCDDQNPCTIDTCQSDGTCGSSNVADGPLPQQIAGDCRRDDCVDGEVVSTNDRADIADDSEPCTTDSCNDGNPIHTPIPNDTACSIGTSPGKCIVGVCTVECSANKPCDDTNPCTEDTCNANMGTCTFVPFDGRPTPDFQEPVGDCKLHICEQGVDVALNDPADTPEDMNSCTFDVCTEGVGSNPPVSPGTPCVVGQPRVCDGLGACVECNEAADCVLLPLDDDCQKRTCVNHVCGQTFTTMGLPISNQRAGDCHRVVCDGIGGTRDEVFDMDLPEDNNPCTKNICTNGVPTNPNEASGLSCGSPLICDGNGNCIGCITVADCMGTDDFCKTRTCVNTVCGYNFTPAGTDLPTGQTSMDCKAIECDGQGNIITSVDQSDKPVDTNQCTQDVCSVQGVPSNPFEPVNATCNQMGGTVCDGAGACKKANGATCSVAGDCLSGFCVDGVCCNASCGTTCRSCNVAGSVGTCVNVPKSSEDAPGCTGTNSCDGAGTCRKDDGQGCGAASECVSNFCIDGVCCASGCTTACRACNLVGSVGVCTPITSGEDNVPTGVCTGTNGCDSSGLCKLDDGITCTMNSQCISGQCFDGVCCNVACNGTCKSCNITGSIGICSDVPAGQDDTGTCSGANQSCDGLGACKSEGAQACMSNSECLSGFCVDNVCCNSACTATCMACNLSGTIGTCTNVATGQDDVGTCSGMNQSCDGGGGCKSELGVACSTPSNCLSNFCVDGFCCNTACSGSCQACSVLLQGQGVDGTCGPISTGTDPDSECTNGSCNGASTCKLDLGIACTANSQCLSNFCADGVCCNASCGNGDPTDCQACSMTAGAMVDGTCSPLSAGTVCRAAPGACDVAETCNGTATTCPTDVFLPSTTVCRVAAAGGCDVEETCTGTSAACPTDVFLPSTTVCRVAAAGGCDAEETCTGTSAACPMDVFLPSTTVCRVAAAGGCDVEETCTGSGAACPDDAFASNSTVCRAAVPGGCDLMETCTGTSAACPDDVFEPSSTVCRMAADLCDEPENCSGSSATCPTDVFKPDTTVCNPSLGDCDPAETCTGTSATCPANVLEPVTTVCRPMNGSCDVQETCDGMSTICPADGFEPATTECRASAGVCDVAETCSGTSGVCPGDAFEPSSTVCRTAPQFCDLEENCTGSSADCPTDVFKPDTTVCNPSLGDCDLAEMCTGSSAACPADVLLPDTFECQPSAGPCDVAETCTGISVNCPTNAFQPNSFECRGAMGVCDVAESCTGSSADCPSDTFQPNSFECRGAMGVCDVAESCTGSSADCPSDTFQPNSFECRGAMGVCDVAESCTGSSADCPSDGFAMAGTICGDMQSCTGNTQTNADTCNATGTCVDGGTTSCGTYQCNGNACGTMCTMPEECTPPATCNNNMCE